MSLFPDACRLLKPQAYGIDTITSDLHCRHPEVLAVFGEPRRMGHERMWPSFETPRKRAAPLDDG
jgi:hypothetical protein